MKQWYTVSFQAKMNDEDVRTMKNCFFQAMEESMDIKECAALDIDWHCEQDEDNPEKLIAE